LEDRADASSSTFFAWALGKFQVVLMRWVLVAVGSVAAVVVSLMGVRGTPGERPPLIFISDMDFQPRYDAQAQSPFFADKRAMRTPPSGTVPFGGADYECDAGSPRQNPDLIQDDDYYYRGKEGNGWATRNPLKIDMALLRRGQERFTIYCALCHGATGTGNGVMTKFGLVGVASITDELHALMADGEFFSIISNGKGRMAPFASQIKVSDRWAIVAYLRALMRSQNASLSDVPEAMRGELQP
jgi:mono/diheme cytochrome c family protein